MMHTLADTNDVHNPGREVAPGIVGAQVTGEPEKQRSRSRRQWFGSAQVTWKTALDIGRRENACTTQTGLLSARETRFSKMSP